MLEVPMNKELNKLNKMQIWRRTLRAVLIPMALVVLVVGSALPASAAALPGLQPVQTNPGFSAKPNSLNW